MKEFKLKKIHCVLNNFYQKLFLSTLVPVCDEKWIEM